MVRSAASDTHGLALPALRDVRERRGLSQEELAARAGMTRTAVANLERGTSRARPSSARQLADALDVPLEVLLGHREYSARDETDLDGVLTTYFNAAVRNAIYRRAGEHVYAAIPGIEGLWARGRSREEAERDLREALEWWVLTSVFEHRPLPAFDDASLEIVEESKDGMRVLYPEAPSTDATSLDDMPDALPLAPEEL